MQFSTDVSSNLTDARSFRTHAIDLKVETVTASAEINSELDCLLGTPSFPPGKHDYDPKRNDIERVSKCMISRQEAQAITSDVLGPNDTKLTASSSDFLN